MLRWAALFFDKGPRMIPERDNYKLLNLSPSPAWAEASRNMKERILSLSRYRGQSTGQEEVQPFASSFPLRTRHQLSPTTAPPGR
jgi:hypothetical protein